MGWLLSLRIWKSSRGRWVFLFQFIVVECLFALGFLSSVVIHIPRRSSDHGMFGVDCFIFFAFVATSYEPLFPSRFNVMIKYLISSSIMLALKLFTLH